jgi:hypothetical protein
MKPNYPLSTKKNHFWVIGLVIVLVTISCGVLELGVEQNDLTPLPPEFTDDILTPNPALDNQTNQQNNQMNNQQTKKGENGLTVNGPWLVFMTGGESRQSQIWAANKDGSNPIVLASNAFVVGARNYSSNLKPAVSPNGNYVAYIEVEELPLRAYLRIVHLPSTENRRVVMLYDETTLGNSEDILDVILYQESSLAWSPDGQTLAFIGALEGGKAELFLHSPSEQSVTRASETPFQMYMPVWSQDSQSILVTATSEFHRGEGYSTYLFRPDGLWSYNLKRATLEPIDWPFGDEPAYIRYTAWFGSTFHFFGTGSPCDTSNGCWLDILTGEKGNFPFPIVVYDISPQTGSMLATSFNTTLPSDEAGTYLFTPDNPSGVRLFSDELENIQWLERSGVFTGRSTTVPELKLLHISHLGEVVKSIEWGVPGEYMELASSPDSSEAAWYRYVDAFNTGLWLGLQSNGTLELRPVYSGPVHDAVWTPSGESLLFIVDAFSPKTTENQGLFMADSEGGNLIQLFSIPPEDFLTVLGFSGN